jgi:lipooligosaccharide transport system ATP-binding protein
VALGPLYSRSRQQFPYFVVARLPELVVPGSDGQERRRRFEADDLVHLGGELLAGLRGSDWHRDDDTLRVPAANGPGGCSHRRARRETVVDEDRHAARDVDRRTPAAVKLLAPSQLAFGNGGGALEIRFVEAELANDRVVDHTHAAARDRSEGELLLSRCGELAHDEHVERCTETLRELERHRHTAARQTEHDEVVAATIVAQPLGERAAGLGSVTEAHAHRLPVRLRAEAPGKLRPVPDLAIRLHGAVKRYGEITAVNGLDLEVPEGTCVGLLGPNGAGKSTTMRLLTAQAIADEGELEVLGFRLPEESKAARAQCGVVPQLDNLDVTLTVEQNLLVFAHLYRISRADRPAAIERALEMARLTDRRTTRVDKLSGGMRRRLLIARALVHQPRLILLDEPTVGLDPQVRQELWALIDALRSRGTTILMSTHYIEEAQRLADTVLIMSHGVAVAAGTPASLVLEHAGSEVLEVYGPPARLADVEARAGAEGLRTRRTGTSVSILGVDGNGFELDGERRPANLEDVFVLLTGEEIA